MHRLPGPVVELTSWLPWEPAASSKTVKEARWQDGALAPEQSWGRHPVPLSVVGAWLKKQWYLRPRTQVAAVTTGARSLCGPREARHGPFPRGSKVHRVQSGRS